MAKADEISVPVNILGQQHNVTCDLQEREVLQEIAQILNSRIYEIRSKQPNLSNEKVLIFCALDLACQLKREKDLVCKDISTANQISEKLNSALDMALSEIK